MIEAKNLTMVYGNGNKATDDISFNIKAGEIVGFAGPNGAGKTTVIKMLAGILKPTSGTAVINGHDINKEPVKAKMSFAYIADNPDILIQLTGLEYLNFIADMYEVKEDVRKEKIKVLSERFGMKDVLNTQMREYSHGMRQKLMVISALIHDPPAWILDEPMTGLDPSAAFELKQMMREHAKAGNAVLFSTHVLEVAEQLCDRIIIINNGKIVSEGTLEYLRLTNPGMTLEEIFVKLKGQALQPFRHDRVYRNYGAGISDRGLCDLCPDGSALSSRRQFIRSIVRTRSHIGFCHDLRNASDVQRAVFLIGPLISYGTSRITRNALPGEVLAHVQGRERNDVECSFRDLHRIFHSGNKAHRLCICAPSCCAYSIVRRIYQFAPSASDLLLDLSAASDARAQEDQQGGYLLSFVARAVCRIYFDVPLVFQRVRQDQHGKLPGFARDRQ